MKVLFNGKEVYMLWDRLFEKLQGDCVDHSKLTIPELIHIINNSKPGLQVK